MQSRPPGLAASGPAASWALVPCGDSLPIRRRQGFREHWVSCGAAHLRFTMTTRSIATRPRKPYTPPAFRPPRNCRSAPCDSVKLSSVVLG